MPERASHTPDTASATGAPHRVQAERGGAASNARRLPRGPGAPFSPHGVLALQGTIGNQAVQRVLAGGGEPAPAAPQVGAHGSAPGGVVQRTWLFYNHERPPERYFFWHEDGAPRTPPPALWTAAGYAERPEPGDYYRLTGPGRPGRGQTPALTQEEYALQNRGGQSSSSRDVYNPFNRFDSSPAATSFIPNSSYFPRERAGRILEQLRAKDPTYQDAVGFSPHTTPGGYPVTVTTREGTLLHLVSVSEFGAVYADAPPAGGRARPDPRKVGDPGALGLKSPPSGEVKMAFGSNIDPSTLSSWSGKDRSEQQGQVMGASAGEAAANAGFDADEGKGWEWLHMVAHSMGGIDVVGPQVAENLVAGTSECNSQMIVAEEFLKDVVERAGGRARLFVGVRMYDPVRHIGDTITYDFVVYGKDGKELEVYHMAFDCLSRSVPLTSENRSTRYAGRSAFGLFEEESSPEFGSFARKRPRRTGEQGAGLEEMVRGDFGRLTPGEMVEALDDYGGEQDGVPVRVFGLLGMLSTRSEPGDVDGYLRAIHAEYGSEAVVEYLDWLVRYRPEPGFLGALFGRTVLPALGGSPADVPPAVLLPFVRALEMAGGPRLRDQFLEQFNLKGTAASERALETTRSGNCLYEAAAILLGNPLDTVEAFRQMAVAFILENNHVPALAGLDADAVVHTLATPGAWAGNEGDLAPVVLASVLGRRLVVVTDATVIVVQPFGPEHGDPLYVYLHAGHYTVNPVTEGHRNLAALPRKVMAVAGEPKSRRFSDGMKD